jgi:dTDP-4-amino-4,6-dideoxygalactose transaminase
MTETLVPFLDLRRQVASLRPELDQAIANVLDRGQFVLEEHVAAFEDAFAASAGARHAVGVASGTDAITIALQSLGIGPGDDVVVAANACVPAVAGIVSAGAHPVLADAEARSYGLDPDRLEEVLTPRTRAVVAVHMYGQCAEMGRLLELAYQLDLRVVEDAAHAHGAAYGERPAGSLGDAAAFSFYPTKNLGALGDGGAVVTNDPRVAANARRLRLYGFDQAGRSVLAGTNSRLDALQAAVLQAKLPRLEGWNARRRELAALYREALRETELIVPEELDERMHVYHQFVVRSPRRDRLRDVLRSEGIETAVHYPLPIHGHPAYARLGERADLHVSEELAATVLSLPLYPELTDLEQERVIDALSRATGRAAWSSRRAQGLHVS